MFDQIMNLIPKFAVIIFIFSQIAEAKILWQADFETADTSQWHYIVNPDATAATTECSFDGKYSGKVSLTGDAKFLWKGRADLNRSEFHFTPEKTSTHQGKETFYAFSFYLPEALSNQGRHELGYWESNKDWQQIMRFNIDGEDFSFKETSKDTAFWTQKNGAKAKQWHKVAMHILWSTDAKKGFAEVWLDGKSMGKHHFQTLPNENADMFNQVGILRNQQQKTEIIYIDKVFVTDNLTELLETDASLIGKKCK